MFSLIQALAPPTMPQLIEPHPVKNTHFFGGWVDPLRHPRIHGFLLPWVNHSKPPRRDSFPAFDVIHLGKCSRKILQEPKDQDTVPTLNLGMHMKIRQFCIYELSPKQSLKFPLACLCFLNIISATVIPCWSWVLIKIGLKRLGLYWKTTIFQKDLYTLEISTILKWVVEGCSLSTSCCFFLCFFFQIKRLWYLYRILNFSFVSQVEIIVEVCFRTVPQVSRERCQIGTPVPKNIYKSATQSNDLSRKMRCMTSTIFAGALHFFPPHIVATWSFCDFRHNEWLGTCAHAYVASIYGAVAMSQANRPIVMAPEAVWMGRWIVCWWLVG